jgi:hypothetical protein
MRKGWPSVNPLATSTRALFVRKCGKDWLIAKSVYGKSASDRISGYSREQSYQSDLIVSLRERPMVEVRLMVKR